PLPTLGRQAIMSILQQAFRDLVVFQTFTWIPEMECASNESPPPCDPYALVE
ncbi:Hypothetical predicted protein, partial [Marmota monax]